MSKCKSWLFSIQFLVCWFAVSGCSSQGLDQDGGDLTRNEVEYLSNRLAEAVEKEYPILKHKLVTRYVSGLGQSIISRTPNMPPLPYEFRVLRSQEILVFSLPGGIVYVTLGTLRGVELEGQLAAAIAHELAHQQLNHPLILWRRKVNSNRGQRNLLDLSGSWSLNFLGENGAIRMDPGMEEEADRQAPAILYRAQFDPRVYSSYLQILKKMEGTAPEKVATLNRLHPPIKQRLEWARTALIGLPPRKEANLSSPTFQRIKLILQQTEKMGKDP